MNSVLNPEAPEFYPHLTSVTQVGYTTLSNTVRVANSLPTKASYDLFKTFTDFNFVTSKLSENVVLQANRIIATELPGVKFKSDDPLYNSEKLTDVNDRLLDRVNINIDNAKGVNQPSDKFDKRAQTKGNVAAWNAAPVIAKIQVGSATFIGAKNIPRPQLNFKDPIDNSENLWVPKISDKPNNIKPLALNILYNDEGEAVGYEHPYKVELDLYQPPPEFLEADTEPPPFPPTLEETPFTYVDTEEKLDELVQHLLTVSELAIDLEHHSYRTYQGMTCLIQISTNEGGDFIIDALAIREHVHKLNLVFTDPKKLKIFHGAESDVIWLQRDFGVYLVGMFDTHRAAKVLSMQGLSLKHLLMRYCQVNADKKYQLADWRMRPLPSELLTYARMDTHYLVYIARRMRTELVHKDQQKHLLVSVFEQSRQICGATYNKEVITESSHMPLYLRSKKTFNSQQMAALKMLYKWRDSQARALDESTTYLLPNHMLLALAESLPREVQGVTASCSPMPPFVKQNLITIHRMLLSCRELPNEPQLYQMPASIRNAVNASVSLAPTRPMHDFSQFPDYSDDQQFTFDNAALFMYECENPYQPEIEIFSHKHEMRTYGPIVSDLNAEAKLFIPPYERYRKYRTLAQMEEIREYKEKEAKIAAISKGNELIKAEVLEKLQQATTHIENEEKKQVQTATVVDVDDDDAKKTQQQQRKRKINTEKETKDSVDVVTEKKKELADPKKEHCFLKPYPYPYKKVSYKKFYNETNKDHKQKQQPKMKFKKYKK